MTETYLRNLIRESIRKRLNEMEWQTARKAAEKAFADSLNTDNPRQKARRERQHNDLSNYSIELLDKKHGVDKIKDKHDKNPHYFPIDIEMGKLKNELDDFYAYEKSKQNKKLDEAIKKAVKQNLRKALCEFAEEDEPINECGSQILKENTDVNDMIKEILLNGHLYNTNNQEGYDIGIGYGCGNEKDFYYPYSNKLEYKYCHVTVDQINKAVEQLEADGYEFERDGEYVFMKGERKAFKPFQPSKSYSKPKELQPNPNTDPVTYYSDRIFTQSKDGNLNLF